MTPINIKLPDGRFTVSNEKGVASMGTHIELKYVFLVDGLDCHWISVSLLTLDSYCNFQIYDKLCTIHDRITKTLIDAGKQLNRLYLFRSVNVAAELMTGCMDRDTSTFVTGYVDVWDILLLKLYISCIFLVFLVLVF